MRNQFETFLLEVAKVLHFPTLAPDAHGACLILMRESQVPLLFEFDDCLVPNTVLLSSPISFIPMTHRIEIYEASLAGHYNIEETLSVKPDEDMLYLHRRFHPTIQSTEIKKLIDDFLQVIKLWKASVEEITSRPPRATPPHPSAIAVFPYKA